MKQAELVLTVGGWSGTATTHTISFDSVEIATEEFERIKALLKKRGDKGNDLPRFLDVEGSEQKFTCAFDQIHCLALIDIKKADEDCIGLKDAYPHLGWK